MVHKTKLFSALLVLMLGLHANAQDWKTEKRFNILFDCPSRWLPTDFNIELNYVHDRFIFDFSQGLDLTFSGTTLPSDLQQQGVEVHMPGLPGLDAGVPVYRLD
jgi:hypothetical protein